MLNTDQKQKIYIKINNVCFLYIFFFLQLWTLISSLRDALSKALGTANGRNGAKSAPKISEKRPSVISMNATWGSSGSVGVYAFISWSTSSASPPNASFPTASPMMLSASSARPRSWRTSFWGFCPAVRTMPFRSGTKVL